MKAFLGLLTIVAFNYFISTRTDHFNYVFGVEFISAGLFILFRSSKMVETFKKFFTGYPFIHYLGEKQLTAQKSFVKTFGMLLIFVGVIIFLFFRRS